MREHGAFVTRQPESDVAVFVAATDTRPDVPAVADALAHVHPRPKPPCIGGIQGWQRGRRDGHDHSSTRPRWKQNFGVGRAVGSLRTHRRQSRPRPESGVEWEYFPQLPTSDFDW